MGSTLALSAVADHVPRTASAAHVGAPAPSGTAGHGTTLTPREREILALVAEGRSNAQVATQLFISAKTVSVHVSNVMAKVGAASRTEAVAVARRSGLLE